MKHNLLIRKTGRKFIRMLLLLITVSIVTFTLVSMSPIDPLQANVGQAALGAMSQEQKAKLEEYWGVNVPPGPPVSELGGWFCQGRYGDLPSLPAAGITSDRCKAVEFTVPYGICLAHFRYSGTCPWHPGGSFPGEPGRIGSLRGYSLLISSTPVFWLALLLLLVFAVWLKVLPIGLSVPIGVESAGVTFLDRLRHAILPAVTLSITGVAGGDSSYERKND